MKKPWEGPKKKKRARSIAEASRMVAPTTHDVWRPAVRTDQRRTAPGAAVTAEENNKITFIKVRKALIAPTFPLLRWFNESA